MSQFDVKYFQEKLTSMSNEEVFLIAKADASEYNEIAISLAREELSSRKDMPPDVPDIPKGLLTRMLGTEKKPAKPFVDAGTALIHKLTTTLNLPGWKDLLPTYTSTEIEAINRKLSSFQQTANEVGGGEMRFHPEIVPDLQRMLIAEALADLAGGAWKFSDELPPDWRQRVSTYLKAWAGYLDPMALLDIGNLLAKAGYRTEAKETFRVVLLFPTYANTFYYGRYGPREAGIVGKIVDSAEESLQELA